jgi:hypothetical protein
VRTRSARTTLAPVLGRIVLASLLAVGCGEPRTTDPRFATPERTVATLLEAHGVGADARQDEIRARAVDEGGFRVRDRAAYEACFADLDRPGGQALAAYVMGMLAGARDELRYTTFEERASVQLRDGQRIAMRRGSDGAYRIVLADSVPEDAQRSLLELAGSPEAPRGP